MSKATLRLKTAAKVALGRYNKKEMEEVLNTFSDTKEPAQIRRLTEDILAVEDQYGLNPTEYFLFDLPNKTEEERAGFVGNKERNRINIALNRRDPESRLFFFDKYRAYSKFRPFYKRDVLFSEEENARERFLEFAGKHEKFVVKPVNGKVGQGVYAVDQGKDPIDPEAFFEEKLAGKECVIEEMIVQAPEMAKFHPESVNTVRIVTWLEEEEVRIAYSLVRMGVGSSFVDNAGAGGVIAAVDPETGIIISEAKKENAKGSFERHPDTGEVIKGAQIPFWNDLIETAKALARSVPERRWVGWDLALDVQGWVLVEANHTPSFVGIQTTTGKGIRSIIDETVGNFVSTIV